MQSSGTQSKAATGTDGSQVSAADKYAALFGLKPSQWKAARSRESIEKAAGGNKRREQELFAVDKEGRNYRRYVDEQTRKREKLAKDVPTVARYFKLLARLAPDADVIGPRDLDVDLADVVERLKLRDALPDVRDRYVLCEVTDEFVTDVLRRRGMYKPDDVDVDFFAPHNPEQTTRAVMRALNVS